MGNEASSATSTNTESMSDEDHLKHLQYVLEPLCSSRRLKNLGYIEGSATGNEPTQEEKGINPQKEEELLGHLKHIQRSGATSIGSDRIHVPGWNEQHLTCLPSERQTKDNLIRTLVENDHQTIRARWRKEHFNIGGSGSDTIIGSVARASAVSGGGGGATTKTGVDDNNNEDEGDKEERRMITSSYMEAVVECLYYQENLEIQLVAANIITDLCCSRMEEVEADLQPLHFDGGQSSKHYHPLTHLLRFRFGLLGAIPPLVLLTFQGQHDLQLLGTRGLAGLAMHSSNRAAIATSDGLRPLVIHTLSHDIQLRATSVLALNRVSIQPRQSIPVSMYASPMDPLSKITDRTQEPLTVRGSNAVNGEDDGEDDDDDNDGRVRSTNKKNKKNKKNKNKAPTSVCRCKHGHKVLEDDLYCSECNRLLDESFRRCLQGQASWFDKQPPVAQEGIVILSKLYRDAGSIDAVFDFMNRDDLIPSIPNGNVRQRGVGDTSRGGGGRGKNGGVLRVEGERTRKGRHKTILELDGLRSMITLLLRTVHDMEEDQQEEEPLPSLGGDNSGAGGGGNGGGNGGHSNMMNSGVPLSPEEEALGTKQLDRWVTILSLHAMQSLLVQGDDAAERVCRISVDLPSAAALALPGEEEEGEGEGEGKGEGKGKGGEGGPDRTSSFTGLHLILLMCLPPRSTQSRILASRVLVQIAKEDNNIALFQSIVPVPPPQRRCIAKGTQGTRGTRGTRFSRSSSCVELVSLVSQDKEAEITANAVISMLSLSIDHRTTSQLLALQALPKICSLVGAAR